MKRDKTSKDTVAGRRSFLVGAGLAGAAGAAVAATRGGAAQAAIAEARPQKTHDRGGGGYHVTEHVRRYYRSTTV